MGFRDVRPAVFEGVGYAAAFSPEQVAEHLVSQYDVIDVHDNIESVETYHHSQDVYRIEIKVTKVG